MAESENRYEGGLAAPESLKAMGETKPYRNFHAIEHAVSGKLLLVKVWGEVLVGNPGIQAVLRYAEPQGLNPAILLLRLDLIQQPGIWPTVMTWVQARYAAILPEAGLYKQVTITNRDLGDITIDVIPI